ncbi:hypothetical protein QE369_001890 [Agrobacterium larrymoorei]|uniref:Uncharacterized protein n=1 Tax=Agrobacterium larrymoorei TaxID=160699 RepID=A0AAJ2EUR2_9HYPH|nr:hypothetical protein [Agrobacterium larrymoorei]
MRLEHAGCRQRRSRWTRCRAICLSRLGLDGSHDGPSQFCACNHPPNRRGRQQSDKPASHLATEDDYAQCLIVHIESQYSEADHCKRPLTCKPAGRYSVETITPFYIVPAKNLDRIGNMIAGPGAAICASFARKRRRGDYLWKNYRQSNLMLYVEMKEMHSLHRFEPDILRAFPQNDAAQLRQLVEV